MIIVPVNPCHYSSHTSAAVAKPRQPRQNSCTQIITMILHSSNIVNEITK